MALVCLGSVGAAPGVTTLSVLIAASWPRPAVLVEADPSGGVLAVRYRLGRSPGLAGLAAMVRQGAPPEAIWAYTQMLPGDLPVVVAPESGPVTTNILDDASHELARWCRHHQGVDIIVDCGRLAMRDVTWPLWAAADEMLLVTRPRADELYPVAHRFKALENHVRSLGLVLVGDRPYRPEEIASQLEVPIRGTVADDPRAASVLATGGSGRTLRRSALVRSVRTLADALALRLGLPVVSSTNAGLPEAEAEKRKRRRRARDAEPLGPAPPREGAPAPDGPSGAGPKRRRPEPPISPAPPGVGGSGEAVPLGPSSVADPGAAPRSKRPESAPPPPPPPPPPPSGPASRTGPGPGPPGSSAPPASASQNPSKPPAPGSPPPPPPPPAARRPARAKRPAGAPPPPPPPPVGTPPGGTPSAATDGGSQALAAAPSSGSQPDPQASEGPQAPSSPEPPPPPSNAAPPATEPDTSPEARHVEGGETTGGRNGTHASVQAPGGVEVDVQPPSAQARGGSLDDLSSAIKAADALGTRVEELSELAKASTEITGRGKDGVSENGQGQGPDGNPVPSTRQGPGALPLSYLERTAAALADGARQFPPPPAQTKPASDGEPTTTEFESPHGRIIVKLPPLPQRNGRKRPGDVGPVADRSDQSDETAIPGPDDDAHLEPTPAVSAAAAGNEASGRDNTARPDPGAASATHHGEPRVGRVESGAREIARPPEAPLQQDLQEAKAGAPGTRSIG